MRSWLLCMVRNRSIDILRKLRLQERHRIAAAGLEERIASGEDTGADLIGREPASMVAASGNTTISLPLCAASAG